MTSWLHKPGRLFAFLIFIVSLIYPGLVYFGRDIISPFTFIVLVLALIGLRVLTAGTETARQWRIPLIFVGVAVLGLAFLDLPLAVLSYPVLMSLAVAALFGFTLLSPPSLIERFARLREPALSPEGVAYCRTVTMVWMVFGILNGAVAGGLAHWGSLEMWGLWTGLISYLLMGALFAGEIVVRHRVRGRSA